MTKVVVFREGTGAEGATYRAVAGGNQSIGRTAGEALDALTTRLSEEDAETLIIVRKLHPDRFFDADQRAAWSTHAAGDGRPRCEPLLCRPTNRPS